MKDCPPNAIKRLASGEVFIDDTCIGCGNCQTNCPYGVIQMAYREEHHSSLLSWLMFGKGAGPGEHVHKDPQGRRRHQEGRQVRCLRHREVRPGLRQRLPHRRRRAAHAARIRRPGGGAEAVIHSGLLAFRNARFLWWTLAALVVCTLLYITQSAATPPNGGTWQGYTLGTIGRPADPVAGVARHPQAGVTAWAGAAQGLDLGACLPGQRAAGDRTLHSAAQMGWNVHTLAYLLMWIVVLSGMFGTWAYIVLPRRLSQLRGGGTRSDLFAQLLEQDRQIRDLADRAGGTDIATAMISAVDRTAIGGSAIAQLLSRDASMYIPSEGAKLQPNADQRALITQLAQRTPRADKRQEAALLQEAVVLASRRQSLLRQIRRDIRLQGWLRAWLYLHVPLTLALLVALVIHIVATFFYW